MFARLSKPFEASAHTHKSHIFSDHKVSVRLAPIYHSHHSRHNSCDSVRSLWPTSMRRNVWNWIETHAIYWKVELTSVLSVANYLQTVIFALSNWMEYFRKRIGNAYHFPNGVCSIRLTLGSEVMFCKSPVLSFFSGIPCKNKREIFYSNFSIAHKYLCIAFACHQTLFHPKALK